MPSKTVSAKQTEEIRGKLIDYLNEKNLPVKRLADQSGIPNSTLGDIISGKTSRILPNTYHKLEQVLELKKQKERPIVKKESDLDRIIKIAIDFCHRLQEGKNLYYLERFLSSLSQPTEMTPEEKAKALMLIAQEIYDIFNPLMEASPNERELFRANINAPDIGYITTMLLALIEDEERVERFLSMTTYKPSFRKAVDKKREVI